MPADADFALAKTEGFQTRAPSSADWVLPGDRYRVVNELGRGGMGVVLLVVDTSLHRPLAIKVLGETPDHPDVAERRFVEEARITGQLQHPGIPPVHEVGRLADGRPFFSMKLIEGRTLHDLLAARSSPQADLANFLKIFEQIAQTIAYAHSQCVIHRDLKPQNIMVGTFGEVQVMDWGLAKRLGRGNPTEASLADPSSSPASDEGGSAFPISGSAELADIQTQAGQVMGTFAYMAPEQARGDAPARDHSWDVFGLGAILCTILTGNPPYLGQTPLEVHSQARNADLHAAWERLEACGADPELVALAKRCLAPKSEDRPHTAGQVAVEIGLYLASVRERLQQTRIKQAEAEVAAHEERKRRRLAVVLAAAIVVLVVSASAFGVWYANEQVRRDARIRDLNREVAAALDEATNARADLHAQLADPKEAARFLSEPHQWQALLDSAHTAWRRADTLARSGREAIAPDLNERLATLAEQLKVDEQERQLAFTLDRIRLEASTLVDGQAGLTAATAKLSQLFHDAGYRIESDDPVKVAARLRDSKIRLPLVAGLDFWAVATDDGPLRARLFEVARLADPDPWRRRFRQPDAWADRAKLKALADEVNVNDQSPQLLAALARRLGDGGALARRALIARPRDLWLLLQLGLSSTNPVDQVGAFRAAMAVRPEAAVLYYDLGFVQQFQKQPAEAAACYRRAIELDPKFGDAYNNLGMVLDELGKPEEAIACYRQAVEQTPRSIAGHINLGGALHALGRYDEAIASYRNASAINPKHPAVLNNLGSALREKNQLDEAADCFRKSLEIDNVNPWAWCNLGHVLNMQGKYSDALVAMRRGHELGSKKSDWTYPSLVWVLQTQARVALDKKLADVLRGETPTVRPDEYAGMAEVCVRFRKRYAAALRFYDKAFSATPSLAEDLGAGHRFYAACAAIRAADGQGDDASELTAESRTTARRQALSWLRADLEANARLLNRHPKESPSIAGNLRRMQTEPAFTSVRDGAAFSSLPSEDQTAWRQLWADVAALREKSAE